MPGYSIEEIRRELTDCSALEEDFHLVCWATLCAPCVNYDPGTAYSKEGRLGRCDNGNWETMNEQC